MPIKEKSMYAQANLYYWIYLSLQFLFVLFAIFYFVNKNYYKQYNWFLPLLLLSALAAMCVFAVSGDYWSYKAWYNDYYTRYGFEPIWDVIKSYIPYGYDVFRLLVWGVGLVLFLIMCKIVKANIVLAFFLFGVFYIKFYCYARSAVALMFVLLSFVILYKKDGTKRVWRYLLSISILIIGLMMHRSLIMAVPALICSRYVTFNRQTLVVLLLLYPIFAVVINILFPYIAIVMNDSEFYGAKVEGYFGNSRVTVTFLQAIIQRLPIIILYFISLRYAIYNKLKENNAGIINMAAFLLLYTSFLFMSIRGGNTTVFVYRTLNMAMPFMILSIANTMMNIKEMGKFVVVLSFYVLFEVLLSIRIFYIAPNIIINQMNDRYLIF